MENSNAPADQYVAEAEQHTAASKEKTTAYLSDLRGYLSSQKKTKESLNVETYPLRLAGYEQERLPNTGFPGFYYPAEDKWLSLYSTLEHLVDKHFDEELAAIVIDELPRLFTTLQKKVEKDEKGTLVVEPLVQEITKAFTMLDVPQQDMVEYEEKVEAIRQELLNKDGMLFGFNNQTAFQLLHLQNEQREDLRREFFKKLRTVIIGLEDLLSLHGDTSKQSSVQMDFAADLIAFDKLRDIAVSTLSDQLPTSRLIRIRSALQTLTASLQSYARGKMTIIAPELIIEAFDLEQAFGTLDLRVAEDNACHQARVQSQKEIEEFVKTIAALRMGELMMSQKYDDDLHQHYFDHFDATYLTEDDWKYLHPIVVIDFAHQLMLRSNDFLRLQAKDSFVKVLGINLLEDLFAIRDKGTSDYLELASLAIFRRSSYVFQGSIHTPSTLSESYKKGLAFPGAAFWNILMLPREKGNNHLEHVLLHTATESRYFPYIEYEADGISFADSQLNLQNNPASEDDFVTCEQRVKYPSGVEPIISGVTIADFLAMDAGLRQTLEIIPPQYQSTNFIPLTDYLSLPKESLKDKIPFIWLVEEHKKLRRAVIPGYWILKCRNHLEYWHFLQSISGINNSRLQDRLEEAKSEWESAKNEEITALHEQFEQEKASDLEKSLTRILFRLLNQDTSIEMALAAISSTAPQPRVAPPEEQASEGEEPAKEAATERVAAIHEEVWVESEDCTSCKDCVDALPAVFKYNENKQAYVHNPKAGTFAEIVKAAEKCPARCIHPGLPHNKEEASLEKWIKRAEKFN
jgi:ferredoxin